MARKWDGTWPSQCCFCNRDLKEFDYFVDGCCAGIYEGHWGLMCPEDHKRYGYGLGVGRGQKYDSITLERKD
jgi:hypothetical protein